MNILVLHGPKLKLLDVRERGVHGATTRAKIDAESARIAADAGAKLQIFETNHEGAPIDRMANI